MSFIGESSNCWLTVSGQILPGAAVNKIQKELYLKWHCHGKFTQFFFLETYVLLGEVKEVWSGKADNMNKLFHFSSLP